MTVTGLGLFVFIVLIILAIAIFYSPRFSTNARFYLALLALVMAGTSLVTIATAGAVSSISAIVLVLEGIVLVIAFLHELQHKNQPSVSVTRHIDHLLYVDKMMVLKILVQKGKLKMSEHQKDCMNKIIKTVNKNEQKNAINMAKINIKLTSDKELKRMQRLLDKHRLKRQ